MHGSNLCTSMHTETHESEVFDDDTYQISHERHERHLFSPRLLQIPLLR